MQLNISDTNKKKSKQTGDVQWFLNMYLLTWSENEYVKNKTKTKIYTIIYIKALFEKYCWNSRNKAYVCSTYKMKCSKRN